MGVLSIYINNELNQLLSEWFKDYIRNRGHIYFAKTYTVKSWWPVNWFPPALPVATPHIRFLFVRLTVCYRFPSSGRYLPDSSELLDLHLIGQSVDFHHINRRAPLGVPKKKPSFQRKTAQCSKLPVFYIRIAKTATPTQVRTALNSSEKINREVEIQLAIEA